FIVSIVSAALFSAAVGIIVGLPALRLKGIYLAIATFAFNVIVEEIITRWESVTGGNSGKMLKTIEMFGWRLSSPESFYYLCLAAPLHGAVLRPAFIIMLPQGISIVNGWLPDTLPQAGLQSVVFGLILIGFIIFEPYGIYGRWLKIRTYFDVFPFYRRGTFRRQRSYLRSERLR